MALLVEGESKTRPLTIPESAPHEKSAKVDRNKYCEASSDDDEYRSSSNEKNRRIHATITRIKLDHGKVKSSKAQGTDRSPLLDVHPSVPGSGFLADVATTLQEQIHPMFMHSNDATLPTFVLPSHNTPSGNALNMIAVPQDNDILCERGKYSFTHVGNRVFRAVIASHLKDYLDAANRYEKGCIISRIVIHLVQDNGSRFLKRKSKVEHWYDMGLNGAKSKVSHALRDACTNRNKSIYGLHELRQQERVSPSSKSPHDLIDETNFQPHSNSFTYPTSNGTAYEGSGSSESDDNSCGSEEIDTINEFSLDELEESIRWSNFGTTSTFTFVKYTECDWNPSNFP